MSAPQKTVKEGGQERSLLNILLHPLVIIHISDHWTRTKVQLAKENPRVIGAILGIQNGRTVEICGAFELIFDIVEGIPVIDVKYLHTKLEQFKKVFPSYDVLGWYSTGAGVQPSDIEVHKQVMELNESPLYLLLDTSACTRVDQKELPVTIFESELHVIEDRPTMLFGKAPYKIETQESERIAVDHVAKIGPSGSSATGSLLSAHMLGIHNAIVMLNIRIRILLRYLQEAKKGTIPVEHGLLRKAVCLCSQLPATNTRAFKNEFIREYNDAQLVSYLASMTKGTNAVNELIEKFNVTYERHGRRRGFI